MKKIIVTTFGILMLCSLMVLISVGTTMAAEPGYERISYATIVLPTIDGAWTSEDEWTDGDVTMIGEDVAFRSTWDMGDFVYTRWVVEFFSDTTDDPGDFFQFCIDADQSGDAGFGIKFEISGHTELVWYIGGTGDGGWTEMEDALEIEWANSLSASPTNSTPHWILEFQIPKNTGQFEIGIVWNFHLEAYDASNPGFHAWPPTDSDDLDRYGVENYSTEPIPEGLTFGVMVLLSSVSVLVGYHYFLKRKETKAEDQ